jgi:hypothetical protein
MDSRALKGLVPCSSWVTVLKLQCSASLASAHQMLAALPCYYGNQLSTVPPRVGVKEDLCPEVHSPFLVVSSGDGLEIFRKMRQ